MELTPNSLGTGTGPTEWFTGSVFTDTVAEPSETFRAAVTSVHFTPGARTAWHRHPGGQTIFVTEGVGLAQGEGDPVSVIRPGDRVWFAPNERHWHGAAPTRFMTHLSIVHVLDGQPPAEWGEHVADDEYEAGPPIA
jgi:quercetin dioxygenase-like cupin family protein